MVLMSQKTNLRNLPYITLDWVYLTAPPRDLLLMRYWQFGAAGFSLKSRVPSSQLPIDYHIKNNIKSYLHEQHKMLFVYLTIKLLELSIILTHSGSF